MKTIAILVSAVILFGAGYAVSEYKARSAMDKLQEEQRKTLEELKGLKGTGEIEDMRTAKLKSDNERLESLLDLSSQKLADLQAVARQQPDVSYELHAVEDYEPLDMQQPEVSVATGQQPTEEEQQQQAERRQARREEMANRMNTFFDNQIDAATSTEEQERIQDIAEHISYAMDLRQQMRDAETDEQREEIQKEMQEVEQSRRQLIGEQQNHLIMQIAQQAGVTSAKEQQELIRGVKDLTRNPMFFMGRQSSGRDGRRRR